MRSTVRRLAAVAAVGATMGIAGPVAIANAAGTAVGAAKFAFPTLPGGGLPGFGQGTFNPAGFGGVPSFVGPSVGGLAAVIGPTIITTAPGVTFINTNNQVTAGGAVSGGQVAVP
jgi:hypothetical protein